MAVSSWCRIATSVERGECAVARASLRARSLNALSPDFPLGDAVEVFVRREDAERFIEEVRGDDPEIAAKLRIEKREPEAGGLN